MKTVMIIRHAKAVKTADCSDFERELKKRGIEDAERMGAFMKAKGLLGDRMVTSPARRALQTAGILARYTGETVFAESRFSFQGLDSMVEGLREVPDTCCVLKVVGHNPDLEELAAWLIGAEPEALAMGTCNVLKVECAVDEWRGLERGCGQLQWFLRPELV